MNAPRNSHYVVVRTYYICINVLCTRVYHINKSIKSSTVTVQYILMFIYFSNFSRTCKYVYVWRHKHYQITCICICEIGLSRKDNKTQTINFILFWILTMKFVYSIKNIYYHYTYSVCILGLYNIIFRRMNGAVYLNSKKKKKMEIIMRLSWNEFSGKNGKLW